MRRSFSAAVLLLVLGGPAARAAAGRAASYDPEVALLVLAIQKQSVVLLREELSRQAEWLGLGAMRVLLGEHAADFSARVSAGLAADTDVLAEYRERILAVDPSAIGEADRLVAEVRRYHDLLPGPPMTRVPAAARRGRPPELFEETGVGADVAAALLGTPAMEEPVAYAERRFGTTGPFLRRRKWNLDFYLGSFDDLFAHYRRLGYRRFYRLRAPYVSYGRQAYVLAPEPGLRPRLVYCAFYGEDLFLHARAQWAVLTEMAKGAGPEVRTLSCLACSWMPPGVRAMRSLLATVPYAADTAIAGYDYLFEKDWKDLLLGVYQNDYWRLAYYRTGPLVSVTVQPRHTNFGEILAVSLSELVRRGARRVYYAGPAARVDERLAAGELALPTEFAMPDGRTIPFRNALLRGRGKTAAFAGLSSPLFATREWLRSARRRGIAAFDGEMARLAEESERWAASPGRGVACGIGAVPGSLSSLHPEEDRAIYTLDAADQPDKEAAKLRFRDAVLAGIREAGKERAE